MENIYKNKVAVITGAGGGIGSAIAEKLARQGIKLVLLGGNNLDKLQNVYDKVTQYTQALMLPGDLTDLDFLDKSIQQTVGTFGGIDILINNAGMTINSPFEDISMQAFDDIMAINVRVPFYLMKQTLSYLKKSDVPSIINIASVVAHDAYPFQSAYAASKHALLALTKSFAREHYKDNIRVHAISPGGVYTDMVRISRPDLTPEGMIMPQDIADLVWFFLEHRNSNAVIDEIMVHRVNKEPFLL